MLIKYFAWLKNITDTDEEIIEDTNIVDVNSLKEYKPFKVYGYSKDLHTFRETQD